MFEVQTAGKGLTASLKCAIYVRTRSSQLLLRTAVLRLVGVCFGISIVGSVQKDARGVHKNNSADEAEARQVSRGHIPQGSRRTTNKN